MADPNQDCEPIGYCDMKIVNIPRCRSMNVGLSLSPYCEPRTILVFFSTTACMLTHYGRLWRNQGRNYKNIL